MSSLLRLATFNCQNLLSRARVLNLADHGRVAALMEQVVQLEMLLAQSGRGAAGPRRTAALAHGLARYVEVANGQMHFRRSTLADTKCELKAKVIRAVDADVQCLAEVEDRPSLAAFNQRLLNGTFPHDMLISSRDPRGIDIGVLSKLPIRGLCSHRFDGDTGQRRGRDGLEVALELADGGALHLLIGHFRSRGHGDARSADAQRRAQAQALVRIVAERFNLAQDLVAVLGDFGDSPERAPQCLAPLLQQAGLHDVLALQFPIPDDRWTLHASRNEQVDYILISDALKSMFHGAGIERRGMPGLARHSISGERPFPGSRNGAGAASAHAAVWADFEMRRCS